MMRIGIWSPAGSAAQSKTEGSFRSSVVLVLLYLLLVSPLVHTLFFSSGSETPWSQRACSHALEQEICSFQRAHPRCCSGRGSAEEAQGRRELRTGGSGI